MYVYLIQISQVRVCILDSPSELQRGRINYFKICVISLMYKKGKVEKF